MKRDNIHNPSTIVIYIAAWNQCVALYLKVTSFAELMSKRDVAVLKQNLNNEGAANVDVFNIYLKDFAKEDQFTDSIRYQNTVEFLATFLWIGIIIVIHT